MDTRAEKLARLEEDLRQELTQGRKIGECGAWEKVWYASMTEGPFLPQYTTPEYLAHHIAARHAGFGTVIYSLYDVGAVPAGEARWETERFVEFDLRAERKEKDSVA